MIKPFCAERAVKDQPTFLTALLDELFIMCNSFLLPIKCKKATSVTLYKCTHCFHTLHMKLFCSALNDPERTLTLYILYEFLLVAVLKYKFIITVAKIAKLTIKCHSYTTIPVNRAYTLCNLKS